MSQYNPEYSPQPEIKIESDAYIREFMEVSGADPGVVEKLQTLLKDLSPMPQDVFEAANSIRQYLMKKKFIGTSILGKQI